MDDDTVEATDGFVCKDRGVQQDDKSGLARGYIKEGVVILELPIFFSPPKRTEDICIWVIDRA